jgi:hypothetical protein
MARRYQSEKSRRAEEARGLRNDPYLTSRDWSHLERVYDHYGSSAYRREKAKLRARRKSQGISRGRIEQRRKAGKLVQVRAYCRTPSGARGFASRFLGSSGDEMPF